MEKKPQFSGPRRPMGAGGSRPGMRGRKGLQRDTRDPYVINEHIRAREVRLVGDNVEQGIYPLHQALKIAEQQELDLIEISPNAEPPVCRILDYQKFLYQQKKRQKEQKAKAAKVVVKEIRFGPQTDDHDYNFKLKHAMGFLKEGSKVKAYVFFRGRSILFKEQGEVLLLRFANDLEEYGKVEMMPVLEGKRMTIMLTPLKAPAKKETPAKDRGEKGEKAPKADKQEKAEAPAE
ncbi:MAG: translation initiation factor IF-3 [Muribaculaceae bacterium]|nr:translation initiation factor IF-3 [Muribaculaceae bacterium]